MRRFDTAVLFRLARHDRIEDAGGQQGALHRVRRVAGKVVVGELIDVERNELQVGTGAAVVVVAFEDFADDHVGVGMPPVLGDDGGDCFRLGHIAPPRRCLFQCGSISDPAARIHQIIDPRVPPGVPEGIACRKHRECQQHHAESPAPSRRAQRVRDRQQR